MTRPSAPHSPLPAPCPPPPPSRRTDGRWLPRRARGGGAEERAPACHAAGPLAPACLSVRSSDSDTSTTQGTRHLRIPCKQFESNIIIWRRASVGHWQDGPQPDVLWRSCAGKTTSRRGVPTGARRSLKRLAGLLGLRPAPCGRMTGTVGKGGPAITSSATSFWYDCDRA